MTRRLWSDALRDIPLSLLAMSFTAGLLAFGSAFYRGDLPESDEFLFVAAIGMLGMATNSALVLMLVHVPAVIALRVLAGPMARKLIRFSGLILWPVAFAVFVESARLITPHNPRLRPTFWDDLGYVTRHPEFTVPILLGLLTGGMVFGIRQSREARKMV